MKALVVMLLLHLNTAAQPADDLPVKLLNSMDKTKPLLFYVSGDGGFNAFSTSLLQSLNRRGFPVVALDAKAYFWNRKTPAQAAQDVAALLEKYSKQWNRDALVLLGYSFGADVLPFIQTRLQNGAGQQIKSLLLLSPSEKTGFEVHLLDLFAAANPYFDVMQEIGKLAVPVTVFFGADENTAYAKGIASKTVRVLTLAGGHHYNSDVATLTAQLANSMGF